MDADFWVGPRRDPDRIRLGPPVASGAEGVLYRGYVAVEGTSVPIAVKMLQPAHLDALADWTARWREQVELLRSVRVPGLVGVRGGFVGPLPHRRSQADDATSSVYLLMDWVEGVSLDRWAASVTDARPEELLLTLVPVAAALDLLHSGAATGGVPVVHRDVKPANILIRAEGETCLVDVGSVRGMAGDHGQSGLLGTLGYLAPEVVRDGVVGPAADRYALGAVAYFLLTGHDPPVDAGVAELRAGLAAAPLLRDRPELVDHVVAMLDPEPHRRPVLLANWVAQLRRSSLVVLPGELAMPPRAPARSGRQDPVGRRRRTPRLLGAAAVVVALTTVAAVVVFAGRDRAGSPGATVDVAPPAPTAPPPAQVAGPMALGEGGPPPWVAPAVSSGPARDVVRAEWARATNQASNRAILPADTALSGAATPRAANFSGGWGVAWDDPGKPGVSPDGTRCGTCGRSVAGIAAPAAPFKSPDEVANRWPTVIRWSDGSVLGYGWETSDPNTGNMVAELIIAGLPNPYTLWSRLGEDHLRHLISQIRFVTGAP